MAACEIVYLRHLAEDVGMRQRNPTCLYIDNSGAVEIARNPVASTALKHVLRRHFFVREAEADGAIAVAPVASADNVADLLTKWLTPERFKFLLARIRHG